MSLDTAWVWVNVEGFSIKMCRQEKKLNLAQQSRVILLFTTQSSKQRLFQSCKILSHSVNHCAMLGHLISLQTSIKPVFLDYIFSISEVAEATYTNINIYLKFCFWPADKYRSKDHTSLSFVFIFTNSWGLLNASLYSPPVVAVSLHYSGLGWNSCPVQPKMTLQLAVGWKMMWSSVGLTGTALKW